MRTLKGKCQKKKKCALAQTLYFGKKGPRQSTISCKIKTKPFQHLRWKGKTFLKVYNNKIVSDQD